MIEYVNGRDTDEWLQKNRRKSTFPLVEEKARDISKIEGSAFLLQKGERVYAVTASHVLHGLSPTLVMATKERTLEFIDHDFFAKNGLSWIDHPAGADISAIPIPSEILEKMDVYILEEKLWTTAETIPIGSHMAHLGFPDNKTANYSDGTPGPFPVAMRGEMFDFNGLTFKTRTMGGYSASGGPMFIKIGDSKALLVGLVIKTRVLVQRKGMQYRNETTSIPISLLNALLDSEAMVEQCKRLGFPECKILFPDDVKN